MTFAWVEAAASCDEEVKECETQEQPASAPFAASIAFDQVLVRQEAQVYGWLFDVVVVHDQIQNHRGAIWAYAFSMTCD